MNNTNNRSSQKERSKLMAAKKAQELMKITIHATMHSPKKFRPTYIHFLCEYTKDIYENVVNANFYKDKDKDLAKRFAYKVEVSVKMYTDMLDDFRLENGLKKDDEIDLLKALSEFQKYYGPWVTKYIFDNNEPAGVILSET